MVSKSPVVSSDQTCGDYEGFDLSRFIFVMCNSSLATIGLFMNAIIFIFVFLPQKKQILGSLAVLDTFLCLFYVMIFGVDALNVYLHYIYTFYMWKSYIFPCFLISRAVQLAMPYVLIFATLERLVWLSATRSRYLRQFVGPKARTWIMIFLIFTAFCFKSPMFFAFEVMEFPNCTILHRSVHLEPTEVFLTDYYYYYDFYFTAFIQIFLPFALLILLNTIIVHKLVRTHARFRRASSLLLEEARQERRTTNMQMYSNVKGQSQSALLLLNSSHRMFAQKIDRQVREERKKMLNAIYTMTVVCITYLICNSLHLLLTVLERLRVPILRDSDDIEKASFFYKCLSDTVSCFYMLCSVSRVLIYYKCNKEIRDQVKKIFAFCGIFSTVRKKKMNVPTTIEIEAPSSENGDVIVY